MVPAAGNVDSTVFVRSSEEELLCAERRMCALCVTTVQSPYLTTSRSFLILSEQLAPLEIGALYDILRSCKTYERTFTFDTQAPQQNNSQTVCLMSWLTSQC